MTEKQFMAAVIQYARVHGWSVYHQFDSRRSAPGWPDLTLVRPPAIIFAELKVGRGRLSPTQTETLHALARCGLHTRVWFPQDWPQIEQVLSRPDWGCP